MKEKKRKRVTMTKSSNDVSSRKKLNWI